MAQVTYTKPRGIYTIAGIKWHPGQTLDVKAEVVDAIKADPDAVAYFIINGRIPAKVVPTSERPQSTAPEDQIGTAFPANGFNTKAEASEWAAKHVPGHEVNLSKALKTITTELQAAYTTKVFPQRAREQAVLAGDLSSVTTAQGGVDGAVQV